MCLCRQRDRTVGDACGQLCKRVAGARHDDERVQKLFRAERLCFFYCMDDLASAQRFQPLPELRRRPEAAVGFKACLRHDGSQLIKLLVQRLKRVQNAGKRAE